MKYRWYFADAVALAMDQKKDRPKADFEKLVTEIWREMISENIEAGFTDDEN